MCSLGALCADLRPLPASSEIPRWGRARGRSRARHPSPLDTSVPSPVGGVSSAGQGTAAQGKQGATTTLERLIPSCSGWFPVQDTARNKPKRETFQTPQAALYALCSSSSSAYDRHHYCPRLQQRRSLEAAYPMTHPDAIGRAERSACVLSAPRQASTAVVDYHARVVLCDHREPLKLFGAKLL